MMDQSINTVSESTEATEGSNTRRNFFAQSGMFSLGMLAAATLCQSGATWAAVKPESNSGDIEILNAALGHEYQAIAAYQVGAESGLLQKAVLDVAVKFQAHHKAHAQVLAGTIEKLGGKAVVAKSQAEYAFPVAQLKTQADVLQFAAGLEKGAASAYLNALPKLHNKDLVTAAGSILGDETMHWAILLSTLGEDPVPSAFIG